MKRILPVVLGVFVLIFAALLVGPSFVDWNKYKPRIIEQAKKSAGYDINIDGNISLAILPAPHLTLKNLTVAAPRGSEPNLLTMKQADMSVALFPLLSGDIVVNTVRLVNPDIRLEVLENGQNSWMSDLLLSKPEISDETVVKQKQLSRNDTGGIALNNVEIENGSVSYRDGSSSKTQAAENINLALSADTLQGPFRAKGDLSYNGQKIEADLETERFLLKDDRQELPVDFSMTLPDKNATAAFKGIAAIKPALEIQGKMSVTADNLAAILAQSGQTQAKALSQKLSFTGLVTGNEDQIRSEDMDISLGDTKGKGGLSITGLKERNPVIAQADMAFQGIIDLDSALASSSSKTDKSVEEKVAKGEKLSSGAKALIPPTLTMPFPLKASVRLTAEGIKFQGQTFKAVSIDAAKDGSAFDVSAKSLDLPGKTSAQANAALRYSNTTMQGETGVVYADPALSFKLSGTSAQLPSLLRAFVPNKDTDKTFEIWKTGKIEMDGTLTPSSLRVTNGTLDLDQSSVLFTGGYEPKGAGGRANVMVDATTDSIDIDQIRSRLDGQKKQAVQKDASKKSPDMKAALEPVRAFNMPVNLTFDVSAQKAVYDAQTVSGIRIKGKAAGKSINLDVASAQDFRGAAASISGAIADLEKLSGIDLKLYGKTQNIRGLMQSFEMDTSKLPQQIGAAEATVDAKGDAAALTFDARIQALDGTAQAKGVMTGLLDTPSFNNLSVGASHPDFIRAIQIFNPSFKGGDGLSRPFSFFTSAVKQGNVYDLSGLKANLGGTSVTGAFKVDVSGDKPSVTGTVDAGNIPLDEFLGAKESGRGQSGSVSSKQGGGKWSRDPIETEWMHNANLDLGLSAQSITYGGWNFVKPQTKITLKNGNLTVDDLKAGLFGGNATLSAKVQDPADPKQPLSLALQTKMDKVALDQLATALSGTSRIETSGDASFDLNVQTAGLSAYGLVSALQGKASLNGNTVVMKGFDLAQIGLAFVDTGKPLDRLSNIVGGAVSGGETRFDTIKGAYDITQGIATITSMEMDGPAANVKSKGNVNLPQWAIDTVHTITFKQAKEAGAFAVAIRGPLDNPGNTFGRGLFNDVLTRRLQQKAIEKLPDVLGKDLSGKLQGLGILPGQQPATTQKPASIPDMDPQEAPATDSAAPAAQQETAPQPSPEAVPAQQENPQQSSEEQAVEAIQGILNNFGR